MLITRFAPSPTGRLHLGHAYAARMAMSRARAGQGQFLLRLEDIDPARCRPEFASAILEDLTWLGLTWDGTVRRQSECTTEYRAALDHLTERRLLYPCFCTRADIARAAAAPHGPEGAIYPGTCRALSPATRQERIGRGDPFALRLDVARATRQAPALTFTDETSGTVACRPEQFGDVVLARKDAPASYHLCVTHDDAAQGITLVTRGIDLLPATHLHRLLQVLFGWPEPRYAHHRLVSDARGRRLSKRDGAPSVASLRDAGESATSVLALLDRLV